VLDVNHTTADFNAVLLHQRFKGNIDVDKKNTWRTIRHYPLYRTPLMIVGIFYLLIFFMNSIVFMECLFW